MPYHIRANLPVNAPTRGNGVRVAYTSRWANRLTELVHEAFDQVIRDISHELNILVLYKFVAGVLLGDSVKRIAPKMFVCVLVSCMLKKTYLGKIMICLQPYQTHSRLLSII